MKEIMLNEVAQSTMEDMERFSIYANQRAIKLGKDAYESFRENYYNCPSCYYIPVNAMSEYLDCMMEKYNHCLETVINKYK